jgi:SAM-dependent methyltransferase
MSEPIAERPMQAFLTRLRRHRLAQRLRYEAIYAWPGWAGCAAFNVGHAPPDADIAGDADFVAEPNQIQLYAELLRTAAIGADGLRASAVLEIAAGRGGGLAYLKKRLAPAELIGIEPAAAGVRHGRRRGLDLRRGIGEALPFADRRFDLVLMLDALVHLAGRERIAREARRVLKPGGLFLTGDFIKAPAAPAFDLIRSIAAQGGFRVRTLRDVTEGVRASLDADEPRKAALLRRAPFFLRRSLAETLALRGSARHREWQAGERTYVLAVMEPDARQGRIRIVRP